MDGVSIKKAPLREKSPKKAAKRVLEVVLTLIKQQRRNWLRMQSIVCTGRSSWNPGTTIHKAKTDE